MLTFHLPLILMASVVLVHLAGCQRAGPEFTVSHADDVTRYGDLPLVRKTHDQELRKEVARLISEHATPALLTRGLARHGNQSAPTEAERRADSAAALEQIFPAKLRKSLEKRLARIYPPDRFQFSTTKLRAAISLGNELAPQRDEYRKLVARSDQDFRLDHTRGLGLDTSFVDAAWIGNRLEALYAAELLDQGQLHSALQSLDVLLHMAQLLAREPHVVPRVAAAQMRGEALRVLEAISEHPYATAETQRLLLQRVDQQLDDWPTDAHAWIGERAQGLHCYELIRDGYLLSLLEYDEIREYRDGIGIQQLGKQVMGNIDADEVFYLKSMRRVIESCERPFFQRQAVFKRIHQQVEASRETMSYPFVADQLLLGEIAQGHRWQALDQARCRAWQLALTAAVGKQTDDVPVNPITGLAFILELREDRVIVDAIDPELGERPVIARRMTETQRGTE